MAKKMFKINLKAYQVPTPVSYFAECPHCGKKPDEGQEVKITTKIEPQDFPMKDWLMNAVLSDPSQGVKDSLRRIRLANQIDECEDSEMFLTKDEHERLLAGMDVLAKRTDEQKRPTFGRFHGEFLARVIEAEETEIEEISKEGEQKILQMIPKN